MRQLTHSCMKDPCFYKVLEILVGKVRLYEPCLFFKHPSNNVDDVIIEGYPCHLPISISYQHIVGNVPYEREESVILYVVHQFSILMSYQLFSLSICTSSGRINSLTSTLRTFDILMSDSRFGCEKFVIHLDTVGWLTPNFFDNHIFERAFSAITTFN